MSGRAAGIGVAIFVEPAKRICRSALNDLRYLIRHTRMEGAGCGRSPARPSPYRSPNTSEIRRRARQGSLAPAGSDRSDEGIPNGRPRRKRHDHRCHRQRSRLQDRRVQRLPHRIPRFLQMGRAVHGAVHLHRHALSLAALLLTPRFNHRCGAEEADRCEWKENEGQTLNSTAERGWHWGSESFRERPMGLLEENVTPVKNRNFQNSEQGKHRGEAEAIRLLSRGMKMPKKRPPTV